MLPPLMRNCLFKSLCKHKWTLKKTFGQMVPLIYYHSFHRCPLEGCGKQFASIQKMRIHHDNLHSDQRQKCPSCEKTFKKNQQLKIHQYQHTGILPYQYVDILKFYYIIKSHITLYSYFLLSFKMWAYRLWETFFDA